MNKSPEFLQSSKGLYHRFITVQNRAKNMQIQASTSKKCGTKTGPGRRPGYKTPATIKKMAIKTLEQIMQDESASPDARAMAACKLIDEIEVKA